VTIGIVAFKIFFMKIILASKSPRRIELLKSAGFDFEVISSDYKEMFEKHLKPEELVMKHAEGKVMKIMKNGDSRFEIRDSNFMKNDDIAIIGVDTIGFCEGRVLEKPRDREQAREMISLLSGTTHQVYSGICVIFLKVGKILKKVIEYEKTDITFGKMTKADIDWYLDQNEWQDKAAGYAIQGKGALFVKKIDGDFFNVVGLPIYRLRQILAL